MRKKNLGRRIIQPWRGAVLWLSCLAAGGLSAQPLSLSDAGQGRINHNRLETPEMSGISWMAGSVWHAVSDAAGERKVHEWHLQIDPASGRLEGLSWEGTHLLAAGHDLEGIAWCRPRGTVLVSDEGLHPQGGHLREHVLPGGEMLAEVGMPAVMLRDRPNFGLESCTWGAGALWTANEEAFEHESALSGAATGSLVRLQKFDHRFQPAGQWAYLTDSKGAESVFTNQTRSGVVDLLVLPDGRLLVLERTLGLSTLLPSFRNRIYLVDFGGATQTGGIPDLDDAVVVPVGKTLLWEQNHGVLPSANFEGMGLGPRLQLADGPARSVILVADNGGDTNGTQHFLALVLRGVVERGAYDEWCLGLFGAHASHQAELAPTADPDGDGLCNRMEYAFGGDPFDAGSRPLPRMRDDEDGMPGFEFARYRSHDDLILTVQSAPEPGGPWFAIARSSRGGEMEPLVEGMVISEEGDWLKRHVRVRQAVVEERLFYRVELALEVVP